jgi:Zn-dependent M28 family amino/carboxypeptidase
LGFLEGGDLKDQVLVISAHYDHLGKKDSIIYFGADDDGSGTVSLLELAAAFQRQKQLARAPKEHLVPRQFREEKDCGDRILYGPSVVSYGQDDG